MSRYATFSLGMIAVCAPAHPVIAWIWLAWLGFTLAFDWMIEMSKEPRSDGD